MKTPTATIGIRGTIYIAEYVSPEEAAEGASMPTLLALADTAVMSDAAPFLVATEVEVTRSSELSTGLYVQVISGVINLTNGGGSQNFSAGQFGFTSSFTQPPVILPTNPGMRFTTPPSFGSGRFDGSGQGTGGASGGGADCQVR